MQEPSENNLDMLWWKLTLGPCETGIVSINSIRSGKTMTFLTNQPSRARMCNKIIVKKTIVIING